MSPLDRPGAISARNGFWAYGRTQTDRHSNARINQALHVTTQVPHRMLSRRHGQAPAAADRADAEGTVRLR